MLPSKCIHTGEHGCVLLCPAPLLATWLAGWLCLSVFLRPTVGGWVGFTAVVFFFHGISIRSAALIELKNSWGAVGDLIDNQAAASSIFAAKPLPRCIRHPDSDFSTKWDMLQVCALGYVSVMVPLRTCFDLDNNDTSTFGFWLEAIVDAYFVIDIILCFRTAFWAANGELVGDSSSIAIYYMKSWFFIDVLSCLPLGYVEMIMTAGGEVDEAADTARRTLRTKRPSDGEGGSWVGEGTTDNDFNFKTFKTLRLFRLGKLLRIARIKRMLKKYEDQFDANQYLGMLFTLLIIFFMGHILGCFFFLVGTGEIVQCTGDPALEQEVCTTIKGWVYNAAGGPDGTGGWTEEMFKGNPPQVSLGRRYSAS